MNFLVTGGAGFIGSHVCEQLIAQDHKVVCIDNFDDFYAKSIKMNYIKGLKESTKFSLISEDIRQTDALVDIMESKRIEAVIHLAAKAGVGPSLKNPMAYTAVNTDGTVSILEAMKEARVKNLVFASSSSVYGTSSTVPFSEDQVLPTPISAYAASKQAAEIYVKYYHELFGISTHILRFFTVYGPRQRPDLAIYKFVKAIAQREPITLNGDGSMQRDYTFVTDICQGILASAFQLTSDKNSVCKTYNLGNSSPIDLNGLIACIEQVVNKKAIIKYRDVPLGDVPLTFANVQKAQKELQYQPKTSLENGISVFYDWMKLEGICT